MIGFTQTQTEIQSKELKQRLTDEMLSLCESAQDRELSYHETIILAPMYIRMSTITSVPIPSAVLEIYKKYLYNHAGHAYSLLFQKARKRWTTTARTKSFLFDEIFDEAINQFGKHQLKN